jgi:predicted GH43/DUF377 family glycosyl hydrolase
LTILNTIPLARYSGNPILRPDALHPWEALNVFNPGAVYHNGLFHLLYRAQGVDYISSIGYAVSVDGFHWLRLNQPVLSPSGEFELRGVEDPRLTFLEGKFYMVYGAYSPSGIFVSLAESENLVAWKRLGVILPGEDNKDAALFPEKINGRYCLLHRRPPDIWLAYSTDLVHWTGHQKILSPRRDAWDEVRVGIAGPPLRTDQGWLQIYHGVDRSNTYRLGAFLMDLAGPSRVKARLARPILEPVEPWELKGDVPNVVFSCGQVVKEDTLYVYYGGADRVLAVATCSLAELIASLTTN